MPTQLTAWTDSTGRLYNNFEDANRSDLTAAFHIEMGRSYSSHHNMTASNLLVVMAKDPQPAIAALGKVVAALGGRRATASTADRTDRLGRAFDICDSIGDGAPDDSPLALEALRLAGDIRAALGDAP